MKPVLSGHPRDPHLIEVSLNRGACLVQIHFTENKGRKLVFIEAGVGLMQGACLIWGLLNTVFNELSIISNTPGVFLLIT